MTSCLALMVLLGLFAQTPRTDSPSRVDCRDWRECRQRALEAAQSGQFETFHDLAWRAVSRGPSDDPELLFLLAHAQSLSGRPQDALVMLQRLAQRGVTTDAAESEAFRRVRALPGWAEFETARI